MSHHPFIHDDFLLETSQACELYHRFAKLAPIYDYHCHLPPAEIASNHEFPDIADIWMGGDHYKWRAMRANGVSEDYCTGKASPREKFDAWVATVPYCLRNPLYHWSHLELKRYFDLDLRIEPANADAIWEACNAKLPELRTQSILDHFNVAAICTTDDPVDPIDLHGAIAKQDLNTRVYPTFRPDKAYAISDPKAFIVWLKKLSNSSGITVSTFDDFMNALEKRHADFHDAGCRLSDHGLEQCPSEPCSTGEAASIFNRLMEGRNPNAGSELKFASFLLRQFGRWAAKRGWTQQLHLGPLRNNSSRQFARLGPDTGFDSIGESVSVKSVQHYLDDLDATGELPKIVLYNLNPSDNYALTTMLGNFQDGSLAGKMQFGSGWWFLDQEEAMQWQMNTLSQLGILRRFVGMLTDSRSFLSYPRHEYFRRVLCNLLGNDLKRGALPDDIELIGQMVREISFENAKNYFGLELAPKYS